MSTHQELSEYLTTLQHEFEQSLAQQFSPRTVRNHSHVIGLFIEYVCFGRGVQTIQEITRGMANSGFRTWYMSNVGAVTEGQVKTAIKKFFQFLDREKGITNETVLKSFVRSSR
jgi:site-specific recombinase XerD